MSVQREVETGGKSARRIAGVVTGVFSALVLLAAASYSVIVSVVNWVTVGFLAYPVSGVAPFVVISGAILTMPIVIPTVLVTVKILDDSSH
ncbi:hypothetical protein ACFO5R_03515 [Halosolutus amylolyticus]|uniref:Uncharacterized protein n=1 Tax=Halosolutus amylolyticus TaxID=2932267 RepID=A0ABD5PK90_9EURY|nr:hypothetical protein [Halosolutus amylolyticus]